MRSCAALVYLGLGGALTIACSETAPGDGTADAGGLSDAGPGAEDAGPGHDAGPSLPRPPHVRIDPQLPTQDLEVLIETFEGTPSGTAPSLLYPLDGVMLPPSLPPFEIHAQLGQDRQGILQITIEGDAGYWQAFTQCQPLSGGCLAKLPEETWQDLKQYAKGRGPLTMTLAASDQAMQSFAVSAPQTLSIAAAPVTGGLYYWTTSNNTAIMRVDFAEEIGPLERYFPFEGGGCYGCHALSRNGRRMTVSQNGQRDGRVTIVDVAAGQIDVQPQDDLREQFQSWAPDNLRFAGVWSDGADPDTQIRIRDGSTGRILERIELGVEPSHPDWSATGDRIAFTLVTHHQTSQRPGRGGIAQVRSDGTGGWQNHEVLVPPEDGKNRYYPAYAPDGSFLIYNESTCPGGELYNDRCDADADPSAKLWAVLPDGTRLPLGHVNAPGPADADELLAQTFPKWAPFVDPRTADGQGRLMWFTFSSMRAYGLHPPGRNGNNQPGQLIWMAAVDPQAILRGEDGSFAPFALPFQDITTSNHIAQWTAQVVPVDPDPNNPTGCPDIGDICDPAGPACCGAATCSDNGNGVYVCKPSF